MNTDGLSTLLNRLNENKEVAATIRAELADVGFAIRMRPWMIPANQPIAHSSILWMTWAKLIRTIDMPISRWQRIRSWVRLPHRRIVRSVVEISIAAKRPDGFGLLCWYQNVHVPLDELLNVPKAVNTKLAIALGSARMLMIARPETIRYSRSAFTSFVSEVIPSPRETIVRGNETWTNVLYGRAPIVNDTLDYIPK